MSTYLIQTVQSPLMPNFRYPHPDTIPFIDEFEYRQFLHETLQEYDQDVLIPISIDDLCKSNLVAEGAIPIGNVAFTNQALEQIGHLPMRAVNIPGELNQERFLHRNIMHARRKQRLYELFDLWGCDKIFVKHAIRIKDGCSGIYTKSEIDLLPDGVNDRYFASEVVQFTEEYRVFVHRKQILDVRQYLGAPKKAPNLLILECVEALGDRIPAYTLDVGYVTIPGSRQNISANAAVVEVHPFLSCGLYGFQDQRMIAMLRDAWEWVKNITVPAVLDTERISV